MHKFVLIIVVLNLIYEMVEIIFPIKNMGGFVKSFSLIIMLYSICDYLLMLM